MLEMLRNFFIKEQVSFDALGVALSKIPLFTPDLWKIEQHEHQFVFEYGDLQNKMPKHQMVQPYGAYTAFTHEKFSVFDQHCEEENFPVAFKNTFVDYNNRPLRRAKIRGELFAVKPKNMILMDSYRQNGVQFERKRVRVITPLINSEGDNMTTGAWMYFGKLEAWKNKIEWDTAFTRSKGNLFRSLAIIPDNNPIFNNHYHFTPDHLKNGVKNKCYVYLHRGLPDPQPPQQQQYARPEPVTLSKVSFK